MEDPAGRIVMSPANCANARNQPEPIHEQNENEDRGEEPEGLPDEIAADDGLKKIIKTLHHPFPEILDAIRNLFHVARRHLGEDDYARGDNPRDKHRVRHRELADLK